MDELELLEKMDTVEPCQRAKDHLAKNGSRRRFSLSELQAAPGHCVWCDNKLEGKKQRWCSSACVKSAQCAGTPTTQDVKMYRLIYMQSFACAGCGQSFEDEIRKMIVRAHEVWNRHHNYRYGPGGVGEKEMLPPKKISLYILGAGTGDKWQTDHIVPVHKGGAGIEASNLQVLCVPCHLRKTVEDRKP